MGVRRVVRRKHGINGLFPSLKMGAMIWYESYLERDFAILLDFDPRVEAFYEQPLTLEYEANGKLCKYTPDFHVIRDKRNALVECKPEEFITTPENHRKFRAALAFCAERAWDFYVVTDHELRQGYRLQNIKLLTRYARLEVAPQVCNCILAALASQPALPLAQAAAIVLPDSPSAGIPILLHLAFHHCLSLPLDSQPITEQTPIGLPGASIERRCSP